MPVRGRGLGPWDGTMGQGQRGGGGGDTRNVMRPGDSQEEWQVQERGLDGTVDRWTARGSRRRWKERREGWRGHSPRGRTSERACGPGKTDRCTAADPTSCALCVVRLRQTVRGGTGVQGPQNHSQKGAVLTVHSDRPRRLWDPDERHRVKTRLGREGESRGERLELHSAREQPLQRVAEDTVSAAPTLTQSPRSASRNARDSEHKDSLVT